MWNTTYNNCRRKRKIDIKIQLHNNIYIQYIYTAFTEMQYFYGYQIGTTWESRRNSTIHLSGMTQNYYSSTIYKYNTTLSVVLLRYIHTTSSAWRVWKTVPRFFFFHIFFVIFCMFTFFPRARIMDEKHLIPPGGQVDLLMLFQPSPPPGGHQPSIAMPHPPSECLMPSHRVRPHRIPSPPTKTSTVFRITKQLREGPLSTASSSRREFRWTNWNAMQPRTASELAHSLSCWRRLVARIFIGRVYFFPAGGRRRLVDAWCACIGWLISIVVCMYY